MSEWFFMMGFGWSLRFLFSWSSVANHFGRACEERFAGVLWDQSRISRTRAFSHSQRQVPRPGSKLCYKIVRHKMRSRSGDERPCRLDRQIDSCCCCERAEHLAAGVSCKSRTKVPVQYETCHVVSRVHCRGFFSPFFAICLKDFVKSDALSWDFTQ